MAYEWLAGGKYPGPKHRGGGQGDREAQTRRQIEKRRLARAAARAADGKPKKRGGRPQGPQLGSHIDRGRASPSLGEARRWRSSDLPRVRKHRGKQGGQRRGARRPRWRHGRAR